MIEHFSRNVNSLIALRETRRSSALIPGRCEFSRRRIRIENLQIPIQNRSWQRKMREERLKRPTLASFAMEHQNALQCPVEVPMQLSKKAQFRGGEVSLI